jgi:hypothetical protein
MKKRLGLTTVLLSMALSLMILSGCDTGVNDPDPVENIFEDLDYTYKFNNDGTYQKSKGTDVVDSGSYIAKDNVLALLRDYSYAGAAAVTAAVKKYNFVTGA